MPNKHIEIIIITNITNLLTTDNEKKIQIEGGK